MMPSYVSRGTFSLISAIPGIAFRMATLFFAVLLGVQSVWLLSAQLARPATFALPVNAAEAAAALKQRGAATAAASIGVIRGDLWAQSAFTYAGLLFIQTVPNADVAQTLAPVRASLGYALADGPINPSAWLLLSAFTTRYPPGNLDATETLKMSYYTGPSDQALIPLRLRLAVLPDAINDFEMRQFIARDLRFLVNQKQKSMIADAYSTASAAGKRLIEQTIKDIDPSFLGSLTTTPPKQAFPD
jgi:hypothetical protein